MLFTLIMVVISSILLIIPSFGVYSMVASLLLSGFFDFEGGLTLNRIIGGGSILGTIFLVIQKSKNINFRFDIFDAVFFAYFIAIGISIFVNGFYEETYKKLSNPILGYIIYKLIVIHINSFKKMRILLYVIFLCPLFYINDIISIMISLNDIQSKTRIGAYTIGINTVVEYLFFSGISSIILGFISKNKLVKFLHFVFPILGIAVGALAGNRSILVATCVSFFLFVVFFGLNKQKKVIIICSLILVTGLAASWYFSSDYNEKLARRSFSVLGVSRGGKYDGDDYKFSNNKRIALWQAGLQMFLEKPFTGVGFGGYKVNRKRMGINGSIAHNSYIDTLAEIGLFGLFPLALLIYYIHKRLHKCRNKILNENELHVVYLFQILFIATFSVFVALHHKAISRQMYLIMSVCISFVYIVENSFKNYVNSIKS
jgi:O-antigen ligase